MDNANLAAILEELETYVRMITKPTPKAGKGMYVCPYCHSGEGLNHTGAFHIFRHKQSGKPVFYCQSCGARGDIFDLVGYMEGISSIRQRMERAAEILHMGNPFSNQANTNFQGGKNAMNTNTISHDTEKLKTDYTAFLVEAAKHITETDYHRGLSDETLQEYGIGYVKEWRHPESESTYTMNALIIPTGKYTYVARNTDPNADKKNRYRKVGGAELFNPAAIDESESPIFIVEGELDALSIIDVGGQAIALGSTANADKLINYLKDGHSPKSSLILALDNDDKGRQAADKLKAAFKDMHISFFQADYLYNGTLYGDHKDANETLENDRAAFTAAVMRAKEIIATKYQERFSTAAYMESFIAEIKDSESHPPISTGFSNLDKALAEGMASPLPGEGFNTGLYIVGGESSVGKTTFALQMADNIAAMSTAADNGTHEGEPIPAGLDVLIISLEMGRSELIAKTISRYTLEYTMEQKISSAMAKSAAGILVGNRWKKYGEGERRVIASAISRYQKEPMRHIYIVEGQAKTGVQEIKEQIEQHRQFRGRAPVVVIDYLQILAPADVRATDKQNTDDAIKELRQISRDYKTPIIAISSFNRESYDKESGMKSFKESGIIEYSADALISLQLYGVGKKSNGHKLTTKELKKKYPREVVAEVIKNRNGNPGDRVNFLYYPKFNYFKETDKFATKIDDED